MLGPFIRDSKATHKLNYFKSNPNIHANETKYWHNNSIFIFFKKPALLFVRHKCILCVKSWQGGKLGVWIWQISQGQATPCPRRRSHELELSQIASAAQLRGQAHWWRQGISHLSGRVYSITCICYYNYLKTDYKVMTSRQHISYKIFGARGLDQFSASRQIEAHNHNDLWHSLASPSYT